MTYKAKWEEAQDDFLGEVHEAVYRGMYLCVHKDGERYFGSIVKGARRINLTASRRLDIMKQKAERLADDEASKAIIRWHPFPEEKPDPGNEYMITVHSSNVGQFVTFSAFSENHGWEACMDSMVKAWAELPRPYEEAE